MNAPAEHHPLHTLHPDCDGRTCRRRIAVLGDILEVEIP